MNKKHWLVIFLLIISPVTSALDLGGIVSDVIKDGQLSTKSIMGAIKSISKVASGKTIENSPKDGESSVIIFSATWCGHCVRALEYMDNKNIPYINKDIDVGNNKAEYKEYGGSRGVPYIIFGDETMYGFGAAAFEKRYAVFQKKQEAKKEAVLKTGDMLKGKISGVQIYKKPDKSSPKLIKIGKEDGVVYMGEEQSGYFLVTTSKGEGWVDKVLVQK